MRRVLTKQKTCESSYCALFFPDPLVISCTAHKNMFLLRAFQDIRLTAGFLQFYAAWIKYFVALLQAHMGKMLPERWICRLSPLLSADTQAQVPSRAVHVKLTPGDLSRGAKKWEQFNPRCSRRVTMVVRDLGSELGSSCLRLSRGSSWILLLCLQGLLWTFACWIAFVALLSCIPCQHLLWTLLGIYIQPKVVLDLLYQPCARDEFPCSREFFYPISSALLCWHTKWINRL